MRTLIATLVWILSALFSAWLILLSLTAINAVAHSGGLDSNGCHAGSQPYHCHRAPSDMVGNRLRCDLGSRSAECVNSQASDPSRVQTFDQQKPNPKPPPKASIDDAEKLFHKLFWRIDDADISQDAELLEREKANLARVRCVGNAITTVDFFNGDKGSNEREEVWIFYIGDHLFFVELDATILLARRQGDEWINQYPNLTRLNLSDDEILVRASFSPDPLEGLNLSDYFEFMDGTVTIASWNFDFRLDRRSGDLVVNDTKYYEVDDWWVNGELFPSYADSVRTVASCEVSPENKKF